MRHAFAFGAALQTIGRMEPRSIDELKREPMLFSASGRFALDRGGPIAWEFLARAGVACGGGEWVIDSRVHMLMPGWYPCIPGWHHDDVPRETPTGQPDYEHPAYLSEHVMAVVDCGTGSFTEYVDEAVLVSPVPEGKVVYREWDAELRRLRPRTRFVENGEILSFRWSDFHRGTAAVGTGWRFFIRATRNTKRPILNELRHQVQVYMPELTAGW